MFFTPSLKSIKKAQEKISKLDILDVKSIWFKNLSKYEYVFNNNEIKNNKLSIEMSKFFSLFDEIYDSNEETYNIKLTKEEIKIDSYDFLIIGQGYAESYVCLMFNSNIIRVIDRNNLKLQQEHLKEYNSIYHFLLDYSDIILN